MRNPLVLVPKLKIDLDWPILGQFNPDKNIKAFLEQFSIGLSSSGDFYQCIDNKWVLSKDVTNPSIMWPVDPINCT